MERISVVHGEINLDAVNGKMEFCKTDPFRADLLPLQCFANRLL